MSFVSELAKWNSFYVIVGSAAGALIGLQFVVLTLIAERPPANLAEAGTAFGSPTIVHFCAALFLSALLHVPWETVTIAAAVWGLLGLAGVAYVAIVVRRMRRQAAYKPQFEDWLFHVVLPFAAYATLALSSFAASPHIRGALFGVGGAALLLLFIGIHNAWDSVAYHVLVNLAGTNAEGRRKELKISIPVKRQSMRASETFTAKHTLLVRPHRPAAIITTAAAGAAVGSGAEQAAVRIAQHLAEWRFAVRAVKTVQHGESSPLAHFIHDAIVVGPALGGNSI